MNETLLGILIVIIVALIAALIAWKWGNRVVYPHARVVRVFGAPRSVKNKPGYVFLPKLPGVVDSVVMPGDKRVINIEVDSAVTSDNVPVMIEGNVSWQILRVPSTNPLEAIGLMDQSAALRFQSTFSHNSFEEVVRNEVRKTIELNIRGYKSTQLGKQRVYAELAKAIEVALDKKGYRWGVDFEVQIVEMRSMAVAAASEARVTAEIKAAERLLESRGIEEAVAYLRNKGRNGPDTDALVNAFLSKYTLSGMPRGSTVIPVGEGLLGAVKALTGQRIGAAEDRVRSRTTRRRF